MVEPAKARGPGRTRKMEIQKTATASTHVGDLTVVVQSELDGAVEANLRSKLTLKNKDANETLKAVEQPTQN